MSNETEASRLSCSISIADKVRNVETCFAFDHSQSESVCFYFVFFIFQNEENISLNMVSKK